MILKATAKTVRWWTVTLLAICATATNATATITTSGDTGTANVDTFLVIGDAADGTVTVDNGSVLNAPDGASIGIDPGVTGTAIVTGAGSQWNQTYNDGVLFRPFRVGPQGTGTLSIIDGGSVRIEDTSLSGPDDGMQIGGGLPEELAGGTGTVTVDGIGSELFIRGNRAFLNVGRRGTGSLAVQNEAQVEVRGSNVSAINIGWEVGSVGTMSVTGAGTSVVLDASDHAGGSQGGAVMRVGLVNGATGQLSVTDGAMLRFENPDASGGPFVTGGLFIGRGTSGGQGSVIVSDPGSTVAFDGNTRFLRVGDNGDGSLTVQNGATINDPLFMQIAFVNGSTGTATLTGPGTHVQMSGRFINPLTGLGDQAAFLLVGSGGTGDLTISNGATLFIDPGEVIEDGLSPGVNIGGRASNIGDTSGGTGTVTIDGAGSELRVQRSNAFAGIGRDGDGTLNLTNGGRFVLENDDGKGKAFVGVTASSIGAVNVDGAGSEMDAGSALNIGLAFDLSDGGTGTVTVSNDGTVRAETIRIGANGTLGGTGTVVGNVINGGTLNPGLSPGRLRIMGDYTNAGGTIVLEIESDGAGGFLTDSIVFDTGANIDLTGASIVFAFLGETDPTAFLSSGDFGLDTFLKQNDGDDPNQDATIPALAALLDTATFDAMAESFEITSFAFDPEQGATGLQAVSSVPEPATVLLFGVALAGGLTARRRAVAAKTACPAPGQGW